MTMNLTPESGISKSHAQDKRLVLLQNWLGGQLDPPISNITPLAGDASFRRYFRVQNADTTYVAMDAPPDKESCEPFVAIAKSFSQLGLQVPTIYASDIDQGFLLLTDFGDQLYVDALNPKTCDELYHSAFEDLLLIQSCQQITGYTLPTFDADLYREEMSWTRDWYLHRHMRVALSKSENATLDRVFDLLVKDALAQPQVCVHRDYHSRNLMVVEGSNRPGVLDFQDAVWGPITYDLLSLLRDCYIDWPPNQVEAWVCDFQQRAVQAGLLQRDDPQQFLRWFDWIGLQRNLKCIGIFSRLNVRDKKPSYLQYIPRIVKYATAVCDRYPEFRDLKPLLMKT